MPKYDSNAKRKRNQEIVWIREFRPELSLKEIGDRYGISAQRVWEILKREMQRSGKGA